MTDDRRSIRRCRSALWASIGTALAAALLTGCAGGTRPANTAAPRPVLAIISCDCPTIAQREALAGELRRDGIDVRHVYRNIGSLIARAPANTDFEAFAIRLRQLPGVTWVSPNGTDQPSRPGA